MEERAHVAFRGVGAHPSFFEIRTRARRAIDLGGLVHRAVSPAALEKDSGALALPEAAARPAGLGCGCFMVVQAASFVRDSFLFLRLVRLSHVTKVLVASGRVLGSALVVGNGAPIALVRLRFLPRSRADFQRAEATLSQPKAATVGLAKCSTAICPASSSSINLASDQGSLDWTGGPRKS